MRRGISTLLTTTFLIIMTVAAGGVYYAVMSGWFSSTMKTVGVTTYGELLGGKNIGYVTIKNTGNVEITLADIYVTGGTYANEQATCTPSNATLIIGGTASVSLSVAGNGFVTGTTYSLLIKYIADNKEHSDAIKITAS